MKMMFIIDALKIYCISFREIGRESPFAPGANSSLASVPVFQSVTFKNVSTTSYLTLAYHDYRTCEFILIIRLSI